MLIRRDAVTPSNSRCHAMLVWLSTCVLLTCSSLAQALGLGELRVQSMLGQPLRASIPILGSQADNVLQVCVKAKVLTLDGTFLMLMRVSVNTDPRAPALLLSSSQPVSEPAVTVLVEVICDGNISRDYQILLDPPDTALPQRATATATVPANAGEPSSRSGTSANPVATAGAMLTQPPLSRAEERAARKAARAEARAAARETRQDEAPIAGQARRAAPAVAGKPEPVADAGNAEKKPALKAAAILTPPARGTPRNVLKVSGEARPVQDIAGNTLPAPDGPALKLLLTRRLASDTSPISKAQVQVFSETVRQQQNSAVLLEVGRAEVRTLQQQIARLESELKQARASVPDSAGKLPSGGAAASVRASVADNRGADSTAADIAAGSKAAQDRTPASQTAASQESGARESGNSDLARQDGAVSGAESGMPAAARSNHVQDWVIGLAALLLMCLLAIAWLLWRLIRLRTRRLGFSATLAQEPVLAAASGPAMPAPHAPAGAHAGLASVFSKTASPAGRAGAARAGNAHDALAAPPASTALPAQPPAKTRLAKSPAARQEKSRLAVPRQPAPAPATPAVSAARPDHGTADAPLPPLGISPTLLFNGPPELYKPEKVAQADDPLEFTFPDELELQTLEQAESLHGVHRNSIDYATETEIPTVEEFTDVMYEAEFWISLGKDDKAIAVLEQYTSFENVSSPLPWLFLFAMYRKTEGRDQYAALQRQFQRMFNGKIPEWEDYNDEQQNLGLEHMGGLMARVEAFWMTDDIVPFLESLLLDDRDGTRQGFELGVYRDILFLTDIAREVQKSSDYDKISSAFKLAPME